MLRLYPIVQINQCQIFQSPYPQGGDMLSEETQKIYQAGIELWVNLLETHEIEFFGLQGFQEEASKYDIEGIQFPIRDGFISSFDKYVEFIDVLYPKTEEAKGMLIHCRHGIGRSSLTTLGLMLKDGYSLKEASKIVSKMRGFNVPSSPSQKKLLMKYEEFLKNS